MKLIEIFNLLIDTRDHIEHENEEFICSCCIDTINNLNSVIDSLAEIINPTQKEICNER